MTRRILITNDDGIKSEGLLRLVKEAAEFGEVWIVAPESERSAASHSITLRHEIDIFPVEYPVESKFGVHAYSCSGTPGDCVRLGCTTIVPDKPTVVLCGINFGYNVASDIQYSATCGSAFEAEFQGVPAIAFSEGAGKCHEVSDRYLHEILEKLIDTEFIPGKIYNVNFPFCPVSECKGVLYDRGVSRGMVYKDGYKEVEKLDNGGARYMVDGVFTPEAEDGTDYRAVLDKYVSVGTVMNVGNI